MVEVDLVASSAGPSVSPSLSLRTLWVVDEDKTAATAELPLTVIFPEESHATIAESVA